MLGMPNFSFLEPEDKMEQKSRGKSEGAFIPPPCLGKISLIHSLFLKLAPVGFIVCNQKPLSDINMRGIKAGDGVLSIVSVFIHQFISFTVSMTLQT